MYSRMKFNFGSLSTSPLTLTKGKGRSRKTWNECVKIHMESLGLVKDDAHN